jgi:hypothetical protein
MNEVKAKITPLFALPIVEAELPLNLQNELEEYYTPHIPSNMIDYESMRTDFHDNRNYGFHPVLKESIYLMSRKLIDTLCSQDPRHGTDLWYQYWIQDYGPGHSHEIHSHGRSLVSGVYVLRSNGKGSPLTLVNPDSSRDYATETSDNRYQLPAIRGRFYLWPSWVNHFVSPSFEEDVVRTTFVFNIGFNG